MYYTWTKELLEAGKQRMRGETEHQTTRSEVADLRSEIGQLKQVTAELLRENRVLNLTDLLWHVRDPLHDPVPQAA